VELAELLQQLRQRRQQCAQAIELIQDLQGRPVEIVTKPPTRRGRKSMSPEERREVSERMRRYWERRREAAAQVRTSGGFE